MTAVYKKEMRSYFNSMIGYVFIGFFILITAIFFYNSNILSMSPYFYSVLSNVMIMFLILIPAITMRLFSEELRLKTDQLLLTSPTTVTGIVLGKFFAAVSLFVAAILITCLFPIIMSRYGEIPVAQIAGTYIGFFLVGTCFISVGIFISTMTENQIISAVATFSVLFLMFIMDNVTYGMPTDRFASLIFVGALIVLGTLVVYMLVKNIYVTGVIFLLAVVTAVISFFVNNTVFDGAIVNFFDWFSVMARYNSFYIGILSVTDIVYYVSFIGVFVYLTKMVIERRRWS